MLNEITSYEQLHEMMTRTVEGIGHIGQQLILIERAGYSPEEYHRQRDLMFAYLIQERAKLDYYRTLSENYMTVLHDYEVLRMLNQDIEMPGVDRKQLEEEIIRLSAILPEGLKAEISGEPSKEDEVEKVEEISSIEDLDRRIREEQDRLVELHRQSRQIEESVLSEEDKAARKAELQGAFAEVGENLAKYISMRETYTVVRTNRERIKTLGAKVPSDDVERLEIENRINELERENARKSESLTSALLESMGAKEQTVVEENVERNSEVSEVQEEQVVVPAEETVVEERNAEVGGEVPVESTEESSEETTEEPVEEEKELDEDKNKEEIEKEIKIDENINKERNAEAEKEVPVEETPVEEKELDEDKNKEELEKEIKIDENVNKERNTEAEKEVPVEPTEDSSEETSEETTEEPVEEEKELDEDKIVEKLEKELDIEKNIDKERNAEVQGVVPVEITEESSEESSEEPEEEKEETAEVEGEIPPVETPEEQVNEQDYLDVELAALREELAVAEERLQNSINAIQEVYDFTRNYRENNMYTSVEDLDRANEAYFTIMETLNDRFVANRKEAERLRREVERLETIQKERTEEKAKVLVKEVPTEEVVERNAEVEENVPVEKKEPVVIGGGEYGPGISRESEVLRVLDDYERSTGRKLQEGEYEIKDDGAIDDGYDAPINRFSVVLKDVPEKTEEPVEETSGEEAEEPVQEEVKDENPNRREIRWASGLTEEQILDAMSRDIYEPVGQSYEQYLGELGIENDNAGKLYGVQEEIRWASGLTEEQILDALSRDIYEPEGESYEQFLGELGIENDNAGKPYGTRFISAEELEKENQTRNTENIEEPVEPVESTEETTSEDTSTENEENKEVVALVPVPITKLTPEKDDQPENTETKDNEPVVEEPVEIEVTQDEPTGEEETTDEEEPIEEEYEEVQQPKRGLQTIIASILVNPETGEPIDMTVKQRKRLEKSNISITGALKNGLSYGNYLYNLTSIAPTIIGVIPNALMKLSGKIMLTRRAKENIKIIRENLENLSDEDLEVLYREFKGDTAVNLRGAAAVTGLIKEAVEKYQERKYIAPKRAEMKITYAKILSDYEQIENNKILIHQVTSGTMSSVDAQTLIEKLGVENLTQAVALLETRNNRLMSTKAEEIARVRQLGRELQPELSSGKHGFAEDVRATNSKMNLQGRRFAKDISTGEAQEMMEAMGKLQDAEAMAIEQGDNETALKAFIKLETTQARESKIEGSIFGRRDTGVYHYNPIPEELDYRPDPFVRNVITTVTTAAIIKGVINELHNRMMEAELGRINTEQSSQQQIINDVNQRNAEASAHNATQQQAVQNTSSSLTANSEDIRRGMQAQVDQNIAATRATHEYMDHDATGWSFNDAYHAADQAHHTAVQNAAADAQSQLAQIEQNLAAGRITDVEAMRQIAQVNSDTHAMFQQAVQEAIPVFKEYAQAHPQIEYSQYIDALERLGSNPTAIDSLNQTAINAVEAGQTLQGVSILPYEQLGVVLEGVPTGIKSQLFLLGSAALMTGYASTQAQQFSKESDNEQILEALDKVVENDQSRSERHNRIEAAVEEAQRTNIDELNEMTSEAPVADEPARTR